MKTIQEIKTQKPVFLHNWERTYDVIADFQV